MTQSPFSPTRRSLMRTTAWATPTIAVATAAPAFAVSHCTTCNQPTDSLFYFIQIAGGNNPAFADDGTGATCNDTGCQYQALFSFYFESYGADTALAPNSSINLAVTIDGPDGPITQQLTMAFPEGIAAGGGKIAEVLIDLPGMPISAELGETALTTTDPCCFPVPVSETSSGGDTLTVYSGDGTLAVGEGPNVFPATVSRTRPDIVE